MDKLRAAQPMLVAPDDPVESMRRFGVLRATYTLAPAADPFAGVYWVLDVSTLGTDTTPAPF